MQAWLLMHCLPAASTHCCSAARYNMWGVKVATHVDCYMCRLPSHRDTHVTYNERPYHGARMYACHHGGIMAPLVEFPPIIHRGGHSSISNCIANKFGLQSSNRVILVLFSTWSLLVLCSVESRSNNERLVQLACDGGRSLALLRSTKHCVCEIER